MQRRLTPDRDFIVILEHSVWNSEHVQHVASGKFHLAVIVRCCDIRQDTMNEKLLLKIVWSSSSIFLPLPYFNAELRWKPSKVNCDTVFTLACWLRFHLPLFWNAFKKMENCWACSCQTNLLIDSVLFTGDRQTMFCFMWGFSGSAAWKGVRIIFELWTFPNRFLLG